MNVCLHVFKEFPRLPSVTLGSSQNLTHNSTHLMLFKHPNKNDTKLVMSKVGFFDVFSLVILLTKHWYGTSMAAKVNDDTARLMIGLALNCYSDKIIDSMDDAIS